MTGTKPRTELLLFSLFTTLELEETVTSVEELLDELDNVEDAFTLFDGRELLVEEAVLDDGVTTFVLELEDLLFDELELDCEDELDELDFLDELDELDILDELDELTAFF